MLVKYRRFVRQGEFYKSSSISSWPSVSKVTPIERRLQLQKAMEPLNVMRRLRSGIMLASRLGCGLKSEA